MAATDAISPALSSWNVSSFSDDGVLAKESTQWIFNEGGIYNDASGKGTYTRIPGLLNTFTCEYLTTASGSANAVKITFVTPDRFFATKNGALFLLGKKASTNAPVIASPIGDWSVADFNHSGVVEAFHSTPWSFKTGGVLASGPHFTGTFKAVPDLANVFNCDIGGGGFEIIFLTDTRFVATKNGALYKFGKRMTPVPDKGTGGMMGRQVTPVDC